MKQKMETRRKFLERRMRAEAEEKNMTETKMQGQQQIAPPESPVLGVPPTDQAQLPRPSPSQEESQPNPSQQSQPQPSPGLKLYEMPTRQSKEKKDRRSEKGSDGNQESVLGNIMVAQTSMLQKASRVVNSDALTQDMEGRYKDYRGEEIRTAADPVKAEELKPASGNFSYRKVKSLNCIRLVAIPPSS